MPNPSSIEHVVMRRVRAAHLLRPLVSTSVLAVAVFALALWGIGREVWVAHVFQNVPQSGGLFALLRFYLSAFENTRIIVQALTLTTLVALVYLARETARNLTSFIVPLRA